MTRPQQILTELLEVLADWDGPADEAVVHAQINGRLTPDATLAEFILALKTAENEGWIALIEGKRRGKLWTLTNKGKAERLA